MTAEEFRSNQPLRDSLHQILESEPMKTALQLVMRYPESVPMAVTGHPYSDAVLARELAEVVGNNKAIKRLRLLAQPPNAKLEQEDGPERSQWADGVPVDVRQAYFQSLEQQMKQ